MPPRTPSLLRKSGKPALAAAKISPPPPPTPKASRVQVEAGRVSGIYRALCPLALVVNGVSAGVSTTSRSGAFRFSIPPGSLGGLLDVLDTNSALSVLEHPLEFLAPTRVVWRDWSVARTRIEGRFDLLVDPADAAYAAAPPILLEAVADGVTMMRCFAHAIPNGKAMPAPTRYRFKGELRKLLPQDRTVTLRPVLAGLLLDQPLLLTPHTIGFAGHLDSRPTLEASGWAVDLENPKTRMQIELRVDAAPLAVITANIMRPDLKALGIGDGRSGFQLKLPVMRDRSRPVTVQALLAGTTTELPGSPFVFHPPPPVVGFFDAVEGPFATGWAIDMFEPGVPMQLEVVCDGQVVGSGRADLYRGDVQEAGFPTPWCGFRLLLQGPLAALFDRDIVVRAAGTDMVLKGSPQQVRENVNTVRFLARSATLPPATRDRLARGMTWRTRATPISIVMPVFDTNRGWLMQALNSVLAQWSANWELICVDDGSTEQHVAEVLAMAALHDPRIRVMRAPTNIGIARATNFGLRAARGKYVAFMDHDDTIEPDAIYKLAMAAQQTGADLIYSDEAITADDVDSIIEVRARPAFSHDYYLSHPYFVHMVCVRTSLAQRLGGWDETLPISADIDFVLRAIEQAQAIAHVPSVLYRWRTHAGSAGHAKREQVTETMQGILARHLARLGLPATVSPGFGYNEYRLDWPDDGGEVLIVIPTKDRVDLLRTCIDSIERTGIGANYRIVVIDHDSKDRNTVAYLKRIAARHCVMPYSGVFNYALMNNLAVAQHGAGADYVLFLNNDVEAIEDGWIQRLRSLAGRPDVGAVGPLLLYGDDRVQHAGVLMAFSGAADHSMKFQAAYADANVESGAKRKARQRRNGYNCNLTSVRDYSAVTAACVMIPAHVFHQVHGFDEGFVVGFNDTDLCLRIIEAGFKVLYDGQTVLYHHESATRAGDKSFDHPSDDRRLRTRWKRFFVEGDPFYNPLLSHRGTDHTLRQDPGCKGRMTARVVHRTPREPAPSS